LSVKEFVDKGILEEAQELRITNENEAGVSSRDSQKRFSSCFLLPASCFRDFGIDGFALRHFS
jgi:hypothetical protein